MNHLHKRLALLFIRLGATLFAASLFIAHALAAELTSIVDRNEVGLNESFRLQVSYTAQVDSSKLDLGTLSNDFEVLAMRPQSNSSVSIVNGQRTQNATTTWSIILAPKRKGTLSIPAFRIEQDSSSPIKVNVVDTGQAGSREQPLLVKVSSNSSSVYVGQQLIVDVKLSAQSDVANLNGPELVIANADVIPLDQQTSQKIENGLARTEVNLKYAVFAKSTGDLVIPVMTYTGSQGGQRSLFGSRGQQVVARTAQRNIKVLPASLEGQNHWFPAENVAISSKWSRDPSDLKVGEPITRTVTITAVAQRAAAISPLSELPESVSYNSYTDQAQITDKQTARGFVGTRVESAAIVAVREGELFIPETRLAWFDVGAKRWKEAVLPAETITAKEAALGSSNLPLAQSNATGETKGSTAGINSLRNWQIATAILASLVVLLLFLILNMRGKRKQVTPTKDRNISEVNAWKQLQSALSNGNATGVRQSLLDWIRAAAPSSEVWTLQRIRQEFSSEIDGSELDQSLRDLERTLFKRDAKQGNDKFDAAELKNSLTALRALVGQQTKARSNTPQLGKLYDT